MKSKKRIRFKKKKSRKQKGGDVKNFLEKADPTGAISGIVNGFFLVKGQINATAIKRKMPKMFYKDKDKDIEYYLTPRTCEMLVCTISDILSKKVDLQKLKNNDELQRVLIPDKDEYETSFKIYGINAVPLDVCNPILSEDGRSVRLSELFKGEKGEQLTIYDLQILNLFHNFFIIYALSTKPTEGGGFWDDFFGSNKVSSDAEETGAEKEPEEEEEEEAVTEAIPVSSDESGRKKQYIDVTYELDDEENASESEFVFHDTPENYDDVEGNWNRIFKDVTIFEKFYDDMVSILTFMLLKRYRNYPVEKDLTLNTLLPQDVCPGKTAKNFFKQTYRTCKWKDSKYYQDRQFDKAQIQFLTVTAFNKYKDIFKHRNITRRVSEPVKRTKSVRRTTRRVKSVPGVDDEAPRRSELRKMQSELNRLIPDRRTKSQIADDEFEAQLQGFDKTLQSNLKVTDSRLKSYLQKSDDKRTSSPSASQDSAAAGAG